MALLSNEDIRFRRVAWDDIVMSFPEHADLFFSVFHQDGTMAKELADAARQWMPFCVEDMMSYRPRLRHQGHTLSFLIWRTLIRSLFS